MNDASSHASPLATLLASRTTTAAAALVRRRDDGRLQCLACAHGCALTADAAGLCGVRFERAGDMRVPYGYVAARHVRSVESNTMYHVRPGARALTFGMLGCDLRCPYCHNWRLSQALRDRLDEAPISDCDPTTLVDEACAAACTVVCAAYNEPMITAEWAHAVFTEARRRGLATALVSDGNTTPEALAYLRPVTDVYRVDVKGLTAAEYRVLGGDPAAPLAAISEARRLGYWVEAVTVVVPGFNDDVAELRALAAALVAIDRDLPWHLNAFVPRYRMRDRPRTAAAILVSAAGTAYAQGMRYVYVGNVPDVVPELSHTRCPACRREVVRRRNYEAEAVTLADGRCAACATPIPGLWT